MVCQCCGVEAPTKYVAFYQNIGVLVMRFSKSISGDLCKSCIHNRFWEFTLINASLGWWGVISFVVNPFFILNNVGRYIFCLSMEPVPPGAEKVHLNDETYARINEHMSEIEERLEGREPLEEIARQVALKSGSRPGEAFLVVRGVQNHLKENGLLRA